MSYSICFQPLSLINLALLPSSIVNCNVSTLPMGSFNSRLLMDEMYHLITKHCLFFSLKVTLRASKSDYLLTQVFSRADMVLYTHPGQQKTQDLFEPGLALIPLVLNTVFRLNPPGCVLDCSLNSLNLK